MRKTITFVLVLFAVASPFWAATGGGIQSATAGGIQAATGGGIQGATAGGIQAATAATVPGGGGNAQGATASEIQPTGGVASQGGPQFTIRFFDQKVYFLGDPIQVEAVITNTGADTLRFRVADNRFFSLDFDVRTMTNVGLDRAREFIIARNSDQPVFFRELSLEPGEKYGIVVDIAAYARFLSPGEYVLQASFFPELFRGADSSTMKSNRLALNLRPRVATVEEKRVVEAETGALIARQVLPPDEVVSFTIAARQKSQWEKFFLYLDMESLMRKNPAKDRSFRNATEAARRQMVDQFRQQLRAMTITQDISVIPTSFQVLKTSYDASEATVQVMEKFKYPDYTELKAYTYHLKKVDRYWIVDDYEIRNQGTE